MSVCYFWGNFALVCILDQWLGRVALEMAGRVSEHGMNVPRADFACGSGIKRFGIMEEFRRQGLAHAYAELDRKWTVRGVTLSIAASLMAVSFILMGISAQDRTMRRPVKPPAAAELLSK